MPVMKICQKTDKNGCGKTKPITAFHLNNANKDGRTRYCSDCINASNQEKKSLADIEQQHDNRKQDLFNQFVGLKPSNTKAQEHGRKRINV